MELNFYYLYKFVTKKGGFNVNDINKRLFVIRNNGKK